MKRTPLKRKTPLRARGSSLSGPRKSTLRRSRVRTANPKRKRSEWKRAYHSAERVAFVKALPCVACGFDGFPLRENAHTVNGGAGRKGDYVTIIPLCKSCHTKQHRKGWSALFGANPSLQIVLHCQATELAWQAPRSTTEASRE